MIALLKEGHPLGFGDVQLLRKTHADKTAGVCASQLNPDGRAELLCWLKVLLEECGS